MKKNKSSSVTAIDKIQTYLHHIYISYFIKRVPFTYDKVVTGLSAVDLPYFSARLYQEIKLLDEAIGSYHAEKSLEIGAGYARLTPWIAQHSSNHYAVEPESQFLEKDLTLYPNSSYPNIHFYHAKSQDLPFPDSYFDLVIAWTVLQHLPPTELPKAAKEIKRVCKPNSIIILGELVKTDTYITPPIGTWLYNFKEWKDLFSPWTLVRCRERKLETTFKDFAGYVMRFEK